MRDDRHGRIRQWFQDYVIGPSDPEYLDCLKRNKAWRFNWLVGFFL